MISSWLIWKLLRTSIKQESDYRGQGRPHFKQLPRVTNMSTEVYTNKATGTTVEVIEDGKGFKTITSYKATKNVESCQETQKHKTYSGVEKLLSKRGATK